MSGPVNAGLRGSSVINSVLKPSVQSPPINIIAEVEVEAIPTASGLNLRAATHQYAKPRTEVTPVVATSEPALKSMTLLAFIHATGDGNDTTFTIIYIPQYDTHV
jgi:hypothetical protein